MAGTEHAGELANWGLAVGGFLAAAITGAVTYLGKQKPADAEAQPVIASATIFSDRRTMEKWTETIIASTASMNKLIDLMEDDARHREIERAVQDALRRKD